MGPPDDPRFRKLPFRLHDRRWYRAGTPLPVTSGQTNTTVPRGPDDRPARGQPRLTREARRRGGLARAAQLTPLERRVAAKRAARARWSRRSPEERQQVGQRLLQARRSGVPLIPAELQPIWHSSMEPRACERCGQTDATPYQVSKLATAIWTWRCRRHAYASA